MKKILYFILLLPLFTRAQLLAPTSATTKLSGGTNFTPSSWYYTSGSQYGYWNSLTNTWEQFVTGRQITKFYYPKTHIDSVVAGFIPVSGYVTSGTPITYPAAFLSDNFARSSIGGSYTSSLATATLSFPSSAYLEATGGNGTASNYIEYNNPFQSSRSKNSITFLSKVAGAGLSISPNSIVGGSQNYYVAKVDLSVANLASLSVYSNSALSNLIISSSNTLPYLTTDSLELSVTNHYTNYTYTLLNKRTGLSITANYTYLIYSTSAGAPVPNLGKLRVYFYGGTQDITSLITQDRTRLYGNVLYMGDSITVGYDATDNTYTYTNKVFDGNTNLFDVSAGASEVTSDAVKRLPQITAAHSKYVLINLGVNDARIGVSVSAYTTNMTTIVTSLQAAGSIPIIVSCTPQLAVDVTPYNTAAQAIATTYSLQYINTFTPLTGGSGTSMLSIYDSGDHVHPNSAGMGLIATVIKASAPQLFTFSQNSVAINNLPKANSSDYLLGIDYKSGNLKVVPNSGSVSSLFQLNGTTISPVSPTYNLTLGPTTTAAVTAPTRLSLGWDYNYTANDPTHAKLVLADGGGTNVYGFSVSAANGTEYFGGAVNKHTFFGAMFLNGNNTQTGNISLTGAINATYGSSNAPYQFTNTSTTAANKLVSLFTGSVSSASTLSNNSSVGLLQAIATNNNYALFTFYNSSGLDAVSIGAQFLNHTGSATADMVFNTSNAGVYSTKMRLSAAGNLSLITTPSSSASTYDILTRNISTGAVEKIASTIGTVTNVSSANTDINVTSPTTAPVLTLNRAGSYVWTGQHEFNSGASVYFDNGAALRSGTSLSFNNATNTVAGVLQTSLTNNRAWLLPDASGTVALLSDITANARTPSLVASSFTMAVNSDYLNTSATQYTLTLPATTGFAADGTKIITVLATGTGGVIIRVPSGYAMQSGTSFATTTGTGGVTLTQGQKVQIIPVGTNSFYLQPLNGSVTLY